MTEPVAQPPSVAFPHFQLSDTGLNITRSGFDNDPAVLVVGDVDPHLVVDLGFVGRVGRGQGGGDVVRLATSALTSSATASEIPLGRFGDGQQRDRG